MSAVVIVRVIAVFHYRIDSDESQHLHVVWAWANGLLQYRDVFDNHMPLFQILFAPLLRAVGERADALIAMRLAMVPLYAAMVALTLRIATSCYPRRIAIWSTIIAALFPLFLLCSVEFRTDDLWTVLWLASIAMIVCAPPTTLRMAGAGLLLGLSAAVSAKTALLLLSVAVGALYAFRVLRLRYVATFVAGLIVPPAAIAIYFAARGAWRPFVYGVITHNFVHHQHAGRLLVFPVLLIGFGSLARRAAEKPQQLFLFVTTHFYGAALFCLWPLVELEHWLPYIPLAVITLVPMFFSYRRAAIIAFAEIILVIGIGHLYQDETREGLAIIEKTLQLTRPDEFVMDLKGETVFRRRAFYYVLEPMTKYRIRDGRIRDTIIADMLRTHTMVVGPDHHGYPRATRIFLRKNFVSIGAVRVPGRMLARGQATFEIDVPADYQVIGRTDEFTGMLDGRPYDGPRPLAAGVHTISAPPSDAAYALLWSRAADRGYTPFGIVQKRGHHHRHNKPGRCNPGACRT
ncbi:MAG: hypothetical protein M3041_01300 [Acidobacteriota bacterium]|nr:hypothetical protein [Acidobacteriota bacterium]